MDPHKENSQVLQVSAAEWDVCDDLDLALTSLGDRDLITQVSSSALDLDLVVQELLESIQVKDLIGDWLRAVDGVLHRLSVCRSRVSIRAQTYLLGNLAFLDFAALGASGLLKENISLLFIGEEAPATHGRCWRWSHWCRVRW